MDVRTTCSSWSLWHLVLPFARVPGVKLESGTYRFSTASTVEPTSLAVYPPICHLYGHRLVASCKILYRIYCQLYLLYTT
ncbi:hypothetical protein GGS26DRAFT_543551 [Hypomontagnella submonticulosa]|nr:hypothetical protein GGS26DRAFT_543551 [Hypomontagnella submonticulosa]